MKKRKVQQPGLEPRSVWSRDEVSYPLMHNAVWESAHRRTPPKGRPNGVEIIATLRRGGKIYFVFVKEYRIPFAAYCLEFPAGLLEDNETVVEGAMRELKEETGYVACKVTSVSGGKQPMHSQMSDVCTCFATAEIDGDTKENENPKSRLDDAEEIEVVLVECNKALEYVKSAPKGVYVDAIVYAFLLGYSANHHCAS
ncbi:Putative nudix hydrolase 2 [Toxocara canis]|uniref:Putative nudix hydrolase 2 n=1 Tax=Toxocara canis TaxID=6265 RepID=A0A0B2V3T2_TOXCA|nr:Putative nudix hydrolase 2 [Toxocara canis]